MQKIDFQMMSANHDCRGLVRRYCPDWRPVGAETAPELHGPCPRCGGVDRFYVRFAYAACRKCSPRRLDAVGLVSWLLGVSVWDAIELIEGKSVEVRPDFRGKSKSGEVRPDFRGKGKSGEVSPPVSTDKGRARRIASRAQSALLGAAGEAGRAYLLGRGLRPETWAAFGFGYVPRRALTSDRKQESPAISWPLLAPDGEIVAVRYRYAGPTATGDRYDTLAGSKTAGALFGIGALPDFVLCPPNAQNAEQFRCLVIVEGELNAASIWQDCHETGVDVVSLGAEGQRYLPPWFQAIAARYGRVLAWLDNPLLATEVARQVGGATALRSIVASGVKLDANALLVSGTLGAVIQGARCRHCTPLQRQGIVYDIWDVRSVLDAGQILLAQHVAQDLGMVLPW